MLIPTINSGKTESISKGQVIRVLVIKTVQLKMELAGPKISHQEIRSSTLVVGAKDEVDTGRSRGYLVIRIGTV